MKCGAQIAAAAAGGYLLGRSRKMKWALLLGSMAAGRAFGTSPGDLVEQGTKTLRSPELTKLSQTIGGPLAEAGKAAAIKAASTQMESLTDRLNERAESLRQPSTPAEAAPEDEEEHEEPSQSEAASRDNAEPREESPRRRGESARSRTGGSSRRGTTSRTGQSSRTRSTTASGETEATTRASRTRGSSGSGTRQRTASASRQAPRRQQRRSSGSSGGSARRGEGDSDG